MTDLEYLDLYRRELPSWGWGYGYENYGNYLKAKEQMEADQRTFESSRRAFKEKAARGEASIKEGIRLEMLNPNEYVNAPETDIRCAAAADRQINYQNLMQLMNDSDETVRKAAEHNFLNKIEYMNIQDSSFKMETAKNSNDGKALKALYELHSHEITAVVFANPSCPLECYYNASQNMSDYFERDLARKILQEKGMRTSFSPEEFVKNTLDAGCCARIYAKELIESPELKELLNNPSKAPEYINLLLKYDVYYPVIASSPYITREQEDKLIAANEGNVYNALYKNEKFQAELIEDPKRFEQLLHNLHGWDTVDEAIDICLKIYDNEDFQDKMAKNPKLDETILHDFIDMDSAKETAFVAKCKNITPEIAIRLAKEINRISNPQEKKETFKALGGNPKFYEIIHNEFSHENTSKKGFWKILHKKPVETEKFTVFDAFVYDNKCTALTEMVKNHPECSKKIVEAAIQKYKEDPSICEMDKDELLIYKLAENIDLNKETFNALMQCAPAREAIMNRSDINELLEKYMKAETEELDSFLADQNAYGNDCGPVPEASKNEQNKNDKEQNIIDDEERS
jgi:hypothetical protein